VSSNPLNARDGHYGANRFVMGDVATTPRIQSTIISASGTYMLMDSAGDSSYIMRPVDVVPTATGKIFIPGTKELASVNRSQPFSSTPAINAFYEKDYLSGRHLGGVNVVFADGHVKWLKSSIVSNEAKKYTSAHPPSAWDPLSTVG
jgi:prepilin-type processing-associated H-X9-DG protein